ncbi:MAG: hypothetical protein JSS14_21940 [Proteobacteria bacterium]|nr:hypothetical protein [Pseudomonadota bacterium]
MIEADFYVRARQAAHDHPAEADADFMLRADRGDFFNDPFREMAARAIAQHTQGDNATSSEPTVATTCFPNSSDETDARRHLQSH